MRWGFALGLVLVVAAPGYPETHAVRAPHFTVVTDAGPEAARAVARNLESFRVLLDDAFPAERASHRDRVVVHAVSDASSMALLLPAIWEHENARLPDGIFREGPDKDYVVVRLDAPSEGPYATVYHEYFHVFARERFGRLPLWLDEGLAKFWEMTSIGTDVVRIGEASRRNLKVLANEPSLPLPVLFAVDHGSPHYEETERSKLFYAQSWALVHYLLLGDETGESRHQLAAYVRIASTSPAPPFGDLEALARNVDRYVQRSRFSGFERSPPAGIAESELRVVKLSEAEALAYRGELLVHGEAPERARPLLERALELDPALASTHESLGFLWLRDGKTSRALAAFARAADLDSGSYLAHYYHAVASLRAGAPLETVIDDLERSIDVNPDYAPAHLLVATVAAELGDEYELGLASATKAVELSPDDAEAHQLLGRVLVATGDENAGLESYRRAIELESDRAPVYRELALDLIALGHADDASVALARARALDPDDADTAFTLALALSEAGRVGEAIEAFHDAAALDPAAARYHYRLGELLLEHRRPAEAAAAFERALELEPDAVAVQRDLGRALLASGNAEAAIPHLRAALEQAPRLGILHYQLATALAASGDAAAAEEHFHAAEQLGYQP